jgi:hypothetical protein
MSCRSCQSQRQRNFGSEICIHVPGLKGLDKPLVWAFPKLVVCLDCGFTEFRLEENELCLLAEGSMEQVAAADISRIPGPSSGH